MTCNEDSVCVYSHSSTPSHTPSASATISSTNDSTPAAVIHDISTGVIGTRVPRACHGVKPGGMGFGMYFRRFFFFCFGSSGRRGCRGMTGMGRGGGGGGGWAPSCLARRWVVRAEELV